MRVQLPASNPATVPEKPALELAGPASPALPPGVVATIVSPAPARAGNPPPAVAAAKQVSRGERVVNLVASRAVALPVILFCCAILGWSLLIRLPQQKRLLAVSARELPVPSPLGASFSESDLAALRDRVQESSSALLRKSEEIGPIISRLETSARSLGWRAEVTIKPAIPVPHGLKDLTMHPVWIGLSTEPGQPEPGHLRLFAWMREISSLEKRVEISTVKLQSSGKGLDEANVELRFFSLNPHEEAAAK